MKKYLSIIGLLGIVLVGYLIVTLQKPKLIDINEVVYVESDSIYYLKRDMTLFTGIVVGNLKSLDSIYIEIENGERNGLSRVWNENGQLYMEFNYKNKKKDGISRGWYENRQLRWEVNYKNEKLDGLSRWWHENGQLESEEIYKNGVLIE